METSIHVPGRSHLDSRNSCVFTIHEFHPVAAGVLDLRREQVGLVINRFDDVLIPGHATVAGETWALGIQCQDAAGDVQ
jgi:hypothetical protein